MKKQPESHKDLNIGDKLFVVDSVCVNRIIIEFIIIDSFSININREMINGNIDYKDCFYNLKDALNEAHNRYYAPTGF